MMGSCSKIHNSIYDEDRLSALPDPLIHHILSFLPTTKDAARTAVLSKSWRYNWTHVPNLIFRFENSSKNSVRKNFKFINNTLILYAGSVLEKFEIHQAPLWLSYQVCFPHSWLLIMHKLYSLMVRWIHFATVRDVKELILDLFNWLPRDFVLPQFFYSNTCLIKLETCHCKFEPSGSVNWPSLKALSIGSTMLSNGLIENILFGSPLLESLELKSCDLSELDHLRIDSKVLKKLVLRSFKRYSKDSLKISGSFVECLEIGGFYYPSSRYVTMDFPSLVTATIDFSTIDVSINVKRKFCSRAVQSLIENVRHVKELKVGSCLKGISQLEVEAINNLSSNDETFLLSERKLIVVEVPKSDPFYLYVLGIVNLLRSSPKLGKLVIRFLPGSEKKFDLYDKNQGIHKSTKKYLMSNVPNLTDFLTHVKTVEILGLSLGFNEDELVLEFLEFLLQNGVALEKMVISYAPPMNAEKEAVLFLKFAQKLSSFSRASQKAKILFPEI